MFIMNNNSKLPENQVALSPLLHPVWPKGQEEQREEEASGQSAPFWGHVPPQSQEHVLRLSRRIYQTTPTTEAATIKITAISSIYIMALQKKTTNLINKKRHTPR